MEALNPFLLSLLILPVCANPAVADTSVLLLRVEPTPTDNTSFNPTFGGDEFTVRQVVMK